LLLVPINCTVVLYRDLEIKVRGHSKSLDMVPFDRSHASSFSSSIVGLTIVSEIKRDIGSKTPIFHTSFHLTYTII